MKTKKKYEAFTIYDYLRILPYLDKIDKISMKKGILRKDFECSTKEENIKEFYELSKNLLESEEISEEEKELVREIVADYEDEEKRKIIEKQYLCIFT